MRFVCVCVCVTGSRLSNYKHQPDQQPNTTTKELLDMGISYMTIAINTWETAMASLDSNNRPRAVIV
jgi:hypothetical protein